MEMDILNSYLNDIQKYELLSAEEEASLASKIKEGCKVSLKKLINSNLRLVVSAAYKYINLGIPVMDLIQEGNMGLMVAASKFERSFNTRFSSYAYPWISQYMLRYVKKFSGMISLPSRKEELVRTIRNTRAYLLQENGEEPSVEEISRYLGISESKVQLGLKYAYSVSSLDQEVDDSNKSTTIGELISDTTYSPERLVMREETKRSVRDLVDELPEREKEVIWYRYNFEGETRTRTLREISGIIGVSPEAVRQAEIRAIKHIQLQVEENKDIAIAIA